MSAPADPLAVHRVAGSAMAERTVAHLGQHLQGGVPPAACAVLARVNSALLPVQVAMTEAGIPHTAPLDTSVLGRTGVRTALAYVRLALDLDDIAREDLVDTINRPARKVKSAVLPLLARRSRFGIRQLEQVADALDDTHRDRFEEYLGDLRLLEQAVREGADTARCLWLVRNRIGLGEAMDALDASRTRPEGSSHGDDLDALDQLGVLHPDAATFRAWLTDRLRRPADPDGITLSTVHRVKGMEWDHVVVFAANRGLFPHRLADDFEEERRVFHVAVTRCRATVAVIADRHRTSTFVDELTRPANRSAATARAPGSRRLPAPVEPAVGPGGAVLARPGLDVTVVGGFPGRIVEVATDAAVALVRFDATADPGGTVGSSDATADPGDTLQRTRIPFGQPVRVGGRWTRLVAPTGPASSSRAAAEPDADGELFEALRAWRVRVAGAAGVPPYLVFHDRHLRAIAARKPRTLRELAACPGVGPTKLERYGDDVLDVVDAVRS